MYSWPTIHKKCFIIDNQGSVSQNNKILLYISEYSLNEKQTTKSNDSEYVEIMKLSFPTGGNV